MTYNLRADLFSISAINTHRNARKSHAISLGVAVKGLVSRIGVGSRGAAGL